MNRNTSADQTRCSDDEAAADLRASDEGRVLFIPQSTRDAEVTLKLFAEEGLRIEICQDISHLCHQLSLGAAAALFSEESLESDGLTPLLQSLREQPEWSDFPILLLARPESRPQNISLALDQLGTVTIIPRPVRIAGLLSAVRAAIRSRQKQYELRSRLEELQQTQELLREHDRRKDRFLAVLGHELRNPLSVISNGLQILQMAGADEQSSEICEMMGRQIRQLNRLNQDLSDISRIVEGKISISRRPVAMTEVLQTAWQSVGHLAQEKGHDVQFDVSPQEETWVDGDRERLSQIFGNLLSNAIKYTEQNGTIHISTVPDGNRLCVQIRDSGLGIPADVLPHVFDVFVQVEGHSQHAQGGLGLGLALVRQLVTLHDGTVEAFSQGPGTGSEFRVCLPRIPPPSDE